MGAASIGSESIDDVRSSLRLPSVKSMRGGGVRSAIAARLKSGLLLSHRPEAKGLLGERYDRLFCVRSCAVCARSSAARVGKAPEGEERRARGRGRRASAARRTRQSNVYVSIRAGGAILSAAGDPIDLHTTCQMSPTASRSGASPSNVGGPSSTASASARQRMARRSCRRLRRLILSQ